MHSGWGGGSLAKKTVKFFCRYFFSILLAVGDLLRDGKGEEKGSAVGWLAAGFAQDGRLSFWQGFGIVSLPTHPMDRNY